MAFEAVLARFVAESPVSVMTRLLLQRAVRPELIDAVFAKHRGRQYAREILFSKVVEIMTLVAVGMRPSVHAAARSVGDFGASLAALYEKLKGTEPELVRALVRETSVSLRGVRGALGRRSAPLVKGMRVQVIDGNHMPASEKRLAALHGFRGAALPGHSLVLYEPDTDSVIDVIPGEDAHASELTLLTQLIPAMVRGTLYLADRLFGNRNHLIAIDAQGAWFDVRIQPSGIRMTLVGQRKRVGTTDRGVVYEQRAVIEHDDGRQLEVRRIEVCLDAPTESGDPAVVLLSNVPADKLTATRLATLYLSRWTIENVFQRIEAALHSEVRTLGFPRAALLAFGTALVAYNILATLQHAIVVATRCDQHDIELSTYHLADEVRARYEGMMIAVLAATWESYDPLDDREIARQLIQIARSVRIEQFRKSKRSPKPTKRIGYVAFGVASRHVSTARVLRDGGVK